MCIFLVCFPTELKKCVSLDRMRDVTTASQECHHVILLSIVSHPPYGTSRNIIGGPYWSLVGKTSVVALSSEDGGVRVDEYDMQAELIVEHDVDQRSSLLSVVNLSKFIYQIATHVLVWLIDVLAYRFNLLPKDPLLHDREFGVSSNIRFSLVTPSSVIEGNSGSFFNRGKYNSSMLVTTLEVTDTFRVSNNPLFEFNDNFKSSNVNPLFEENDKDTEIKSSSSFTLTSPEESEFEAYLKRDSIPPGINLNLPPTLEISSSNPTFPTLTREKVCSWKTPMFFSLVRFVWKMMTRIAIRKKIICLLATYLHKTPKPLSRPQEVEGIKEKEDEVSSDVPIHTIVMPIRIPFDNPIDFNDHFSKPKDFKKDLTVSF
ncbi:hypothetical protein Tco_0892373 [Tanacetum coccineum]|uniref:Uncharacterized protein n=1 Tax=Tanacetum coccineum TaxID=301880 RepID=A0ABQ5C606_9ASTR